jgi:hypothetical protein
MTEEPVWKWQEDDELPLPPRVVKCSICGKELHYPEDDNHAKKEHKEQFSKTQEEVISDLQTQFDSLNLQLEFLKEQKRIKESQQ